MRIKIAGSALNQTPMDWKGNARRIRDLLLKARVENVALLALPELCITGYGCEDAFFNPHVQNKAWEILLSLLPETRGMAVAFGLPVNFQGGLFNVTAVAADGKLLGLVPKKFLAGDGVHYEPRWFKAWPVEKVTQFERDGAVYPFGDLHFNFSGIKVGLEICEEAWVAQRPGAALARRGADVILNPSASHFAFGKLKTRQGFVCEGSRAFNVAYVYSNLLGNESGRIIFDGGALIADQGQVVAQGERFSFADSVLTTAVIDLERNRVQRSRTASFQPVVENGSELCIESAFKIPATKEAAKPLTVAAWESSPALKEEEFTRAVALGLFDFNRKSRQRGFTVSLSGGVDSMAVTLLARVALDLAAKEIGFDGLRARLAYIPYLETCNSVADIAKHFITTAYQGTINSSKATHDAARAVSEDAGGTFYDWRVDGIIDQYLKLAEGALGEPLTWEKNDAALQNIQARSRGPAIWIMANVNNQLLLATSNRSEAAVGYATMDGDTCGGISPIGGIDKNFLRRWARWILEQGPAGLRAFPSVGSVLAQPPTAELRPLTQHQTDEDDLMPYDVLDAIEKAAIRDKKSPLECFHALRETYTSPQLKDWIAKFFRLWCRNQWKRERYAPAFHLDDESLDPKTWCRFPILSSGFEEEIAELLERAP